MFFVSKTTALRKTAGTSSYFSGDESAKTLKMENDIGLKPVMANFGESFKQSGFLTQMRRPGKTHQPLNSKTVRKINARTREMRVQIGKRKVVDAGNPIYVRRAIDQKLELHSGPVFHHNYRFLFG